MLSKIRNEINQIDDDMIKLFVRRMDLVKEVIIYKKQNNLPILDESRETTLLKKNLELLNNEKLEKYYKVFFQGVLTSSKSFQGDFDE